MTIMDSAGTNEEQFISQLLYNVNDMKEGSLLFFKCNISCLSALEYQHLYHTINIFLSIFSTDCADQMNGQLVNAVRRSLRWQQWMVQDRNR